MTSYLLDSDVLIWYLRGRPDVTRLLQKLSEIGSLTVSAVTVLEVQVGARSNEQERTNSLLDGLTCLPVDRGIANRAAEYIRTYRTRGITLDPADSLIAATAALHDLTLVTKNLSHYPMPDLQVLREENQDQDRR